MIKGSLHSAARQDEIPRQSAARPLMTKDFLNDNESYLEIYYTRGLLLWQLGQRTKTASSTSLADRPIPSKWRASGSVPARSKEFSQRIRR